jgi:hypothetical protein
MNHRTFAGVIVGIAALIVVSTAVAQRSFETDILGETFGFDETTKKTVSLADLHQGCPARDCIPSIDKPKFVAANSASHVNDDDVVLAIVWQGEHRAYPSSILDRHEIVNDTIAGTPIAITWCPLCGSGVGIRREVDGKVTEFGVSGLLYNSDLVFYDRATETLWDQIEAAGIVGPMTGEKLELIPVTITRWSRWRAAHPDTLVLSTDTGFDLDYASDPYANYRQSAGTMFPVMRKDDRMPPKSVVYGFQLEDQPIAFAESLLQKQGRYVHKLSGRALTVTLNDDGSVSLEDDESGESYAPIRLFWFAWYTFHPETILVR